MNFETLLLILLNFWTSSICHFKPLTLLHSEQPKLYDPLHSEQPKLHGVHGVLAVLSAKGLFKCCA